MNKQEFINQIYKKKVTTYLIGDNGEINYNTAFFYDDGRMFVEYKENGLILFSVSNLKEEYNQLMLLNLIQ